MFSSITQLHIQNLSLEIISTLFTVNKTTETAQITA
jgi:hypothetical protein